MLLIAGSYERLLYGLDVSLNDDMKAEIKPVFIYPAHISCIKTVACGGRFLASGSSDEHIKVYDLKLRKEVGTVMQHVGSITSLQFYGKSHLFSGGEDGNVCIYRTRDWEVLKTLTNHKGPVTALSVHPTGKLLLTAGADKTLRCWDLTRGICAKTIKVDRIIEKVEWNSEGTMFIAASEKSIQVYDLAKSNWSEPFVSKQRLNKTLFCKMNDTEYILTGGESKLIHVLSSNGTLLKNLELSASARIKDLAINKISNTEILFTCHSDGLVQLVPLDFIAKSLSSDVSGITESDLIGRYSAGCRLTCITTDSNNFNVIPDDEIVQQEEIASESSDESELETPKITVSFERKRKRNKK